MTLLEELVEALLDCESWMRCGCEHPACKRCAASRYAREILAKVKEAQDDTR